MALDREAYCRDVLHGLGLPTLTWIPEGLPGYQGARRAGGYDPEAATTGIGRIHLRQRRQLARDRRHLPGHHQQTASGTSGWLLNGSKCWGWTSSSTRWSQPTYSALTKDIETAPQLFLLAGAQTIPTHRTG
jgi:oligopeptide transport system substrate-binding protein